MQWYIIGRDMHVLCSPSTDLPDTLPIDDSSGGQEISIVNNCAVGTYDFTTDPRHPDSVHIQEGNYIAFKDKYSKTRLYTIMTIEGDEEWDVHCEDIGLDLINEDAEDWESRFNAKIDRKLRLYRECPLQYENGGAFVRYLEENRGLLHGRPQCRQHGDYHVGNMMLSNT